MQKSIVAQSKGGRWGGSKDMEGEGKLNIHKTVDNGGMGFSIDLKLARDPKFAEVPDRGWSTTTS